MLLSAEVSGQSQKGTKQKNKSIKAKEALPWCVVDAQMIWDLLSGM